MSVEKLVEHFSALEDPRCAGKVDHRLIDILVIAVCAVIACAESPIQAGTTSSAECGLCCRAMRAGMGNTHRKTPQRPARGALK